MGKTESKHIILKPTGKVWKLERKGVNGIGCEHAFSDLRAQKCQKVMQHPQGQRIITQNALGTFRAARRHNRTSGT